MRVAKLLLLLAVMALLLAPVLLAVESEEGLENEPFDDGDQPLADDDDNDDESPDDDEGDDDYQDPDNLKRTQDDSEDLGGCGCY